MKDLAPADTGPQTDSAKEYAALRHEFDEIISLKNRDPIVEEFYYQHVIKSAEEAAYWRERAAILQAQIRKFHASASWRITAPLRGLSSILQPSFFRRLARRVIPRTIQNLILKVLRRTFPSSRFGSADRPGRFDARTSANPIVVDMEPSEESLKAWRELLAEEAAAKKNESA